MQHPIPMREQSSASNSARKLHTLDLVEQLVVFMFRQHPTVGGDQSRLARHMQQVFSENFAVAMAALRRLMLAINFGSRRPLKIGELSDTRIHRDEEVLLQILSAYQHLRFDWAVRLCHWLVMDEHRGALERSALLLAKLLAGDAVEPDEPNVPRSDAPKSNVQESNARESSVEKSNAPSVTQRIGVGAPTHACTAEQLTESERLVLGGIRLWVNRINCGEPTLDILLDYFDGFDVIEAAFELNASMYHIAKNAIRTIDVRCVESNCISQDETLFLEVFSCIQNQRLRSAELTIGKLMSQSEFAKIVATMETFLDCLQAQNVVLPLRLWSTPDRSAPSDVRHSAGVAATTDTLH